MSVELRFIAGNELCGFAAWNRRPIGKAADEDARNHLAGWREI